MPRNNRDWTADEEKQLVDLMATGASRALIAKTLQRTEAAIDGRAHAVRHRIRTAANTRQPHLARPIPSGRPADDDSPRQPDPARR